MKKWIALLLTTVMAAGLVACGSSQTQTSTQEVAGTENSQAESVQETESAQETESVQEMESVQETAGAETAVDETGTEPETSETAQPETASTEAADTAEEADAGTGTGKALVVYYSATGNTEEVANAIAAATGADVFELEPADPYTDEDLDWTDENSRVTVEHDNPDQRDVELVTDTVDNWEEYDTVFIGYPIWWGIAAWPVDSFVENNDFTGKTVIPFATSSSSGMGESGQLLADLAGTGDWQEGQRFRSGADEADVQEWVNGLGL